MSSKYFQHPRVHPQKDLYIQFYVITFMDLYKQPGRWQDVLDQTACTSRPEDEHLNFRNTSNTL